MDAKSPVMDAVKSVDATFLVIFGISIAIFVGIVAAMVYFVLRYRRDRNPVASQVDGNFWAELIWTVVPTILVLGMFHYGWQSYRKLRDAPSGAMEIGVTARMWSWSFTYPDGRKTSVLTVPVGKPVKLNLTSVDVIHGFYVPAFRIKIDTVPGMTTTAWFVAEKPGSHDIFCSVYCGLKHADMRSKVEAVSPEDYEAWLAKKPESEAARDTGKQLMEKNGCLGCHTLDGSSSVGPTLKDILGRKVVLVDKDGRQTQVTADKTYLRGVILGTIKGTVKGFDPVMPAFEGSIPDAELDAIVDFLADETPKPKLSGADVAANEGCTGCHSIDGSILVGPSFKGLFGSTTTATSHGHEMKIKVDRDYIAAVLADPDTYRTKGFDPVMPGYPGLTPEQREAVIDYLESLGEAAK